MTVRRPVLRYHGGKWMLAPWIIGHFPAHRIYVEPFCGAGSVLLRKPRSNAEIVNDLDDEIVNVFEVLRDPAAATRLRELCALSPYSRTEFERAYQPTEDPIEKARRRIVRAAMAFGTTSGKKNRTGFRATPWRGSKKGYRHGRSNGVKDWATWPLAIASFTERLIGVCVERRPAIDIIRQQDGRGVLFYCDPPYPHSTRTAIRSPSDRERAYAKDMSDDEHRELARALHQARGYVVLSGYSCDLYDEELYRGWRRIEREALADGARTRTEVLWLNRACAEALRL